MKLDIGGKEVIAAPLERVWTSLNDPEFLSRCIPVAVDAELHPKIRVQLDLKALRSAARSRARWAVRQGSAGAVPMPSRGLARWATVQARRASGWSPRRRHPARLRGAGEIGVSSPASANASRGVSKHLLGNFFKSLRPSWRELRRRLRKSATKPAIEGAAQGRRLGYSIDPPMVCRGLAGVVPPYSWPVHRPAARQDHYRHLRPPSLGLSAAPDQGQSRRANNLDITFEERPPDAYVAQFNSGEFRSAAALR